MLRVCAAFQYLRFLQTIHLLCLIVLLLLLSVPILFALVEHSKLEKIEFGATIHASFNELEPIYIAFQRTIAPGQRQSRKYGIFILLHTSHKGLKRFQMTGLHRSQPGIKLLSCALAHHMEKRFHQLISRLNWWTDLPQQSKALQFFFLQILVASRKKSQVACCAERVKSGSGWMEEAVCLVTDAEPCLRAEKPDGSNVSK